MAIGLMHALKFDRCLPGLLRQEHRHVAGDPRLCVHVVLGQPARDEEMILLVCCAQRTIRTCTETTTQFTDAFHDPVC